MRRPTQRKPETMKMSQEQRKRVQEALIETEAFIAKESARRADIRPAAMQQHLDFCIKHAEHLRLMLAR
jgi:predicted ArsR family transcriptional regulator